MNKNRTSKMDISHIKLGTLIRDRIDHLRIKTRQTTNRFYPLFSSCDTLSSLQNF